MPGAQAAGDLIAQRYRLIELLGRGGMGEVWRAEHVTLLAPIAVKLMDPGLAGKDGVQRFLREARAAAALQSPNVVRITDFGVDGGCPYIAMELLEGETLGQRLDRDRRLPPAEVADIIEQVARGVSKAHEAGIVHRDLKPENIFLCTQDGALVVKVLDFGIAKVTGQSSAGMLKSTRAGTLVGTPLYMSPEQARGHRKIDHRADLWTLGMLAFESLCGQTAFAAEAVGDLIVKVCTESPPVPSTVAAVPRGFDAWFARAVDRDPDRRFQSARELADALAVALRSPSTSAVAARRPPSQMLSAPSLTSARSVRGDARTLHASSHGGVRRTRRLLMLGAVVGCALAIGVLAALRMQSVGGEPHAASDLLPPEPPAAAAAVPPTVDPSSPPTPEATDSATAAPPPAHSSSATTAASSPDRPRSGAATAPGSRGAPRPPPTSSSGRPQHQKWGI